MHTVYRWVLLSASLGGTVATAAAQQNLPTTQPAMLLINVEEIKVGHAADHVMTESGWPKAYERAKSPDSYLAFDAMTGTPQVWFVAPYDSNRAMGESIKRDATDSALSAELARLSRVDAEHVSGLRTILAAGRNDLSHGAFPVAARQRFWEITIFHCKPGGEAAFEAAAKAYGAASGRAAPRAAYRVYEVIAGMPSPTYLVFSSVESFADFDQSTADGMATFEAMTADEHAALSEASAAMYQAETHRFRLSPEMSYVPPEVRAQDPAFWKATN